MNNHANIVYRDIDHSPALNNTIYKKLGKLSRFSDEIARSRIVLDNPHKHSHKGKLYRASIELGVKGMPLLVSQDGTSVHIAVRNAFDAAERKLKKTVGKQRATRPRVPFR